MAERKLFIAYHGTYDETGSLRKAEALYRYLTAAGVDCFLFSDVANTNSDAFINTPLIANQCEKFILVCNDHIPVDSNGHATSNGVLTEIEYFYKRLYFKKSKAGDARVYGFGAMTAIMANELHPIFQGAAHFTEEQYGRECFDEVLKWVTSSSAVPVQETLPVTRTLDEIRAQSVKLSQKSEYGISAAKYSEMLLPKLEFDGGKVLDNVLQLELEKRHTYIIYANGGSGKSYSIKSIWMNTLQSSWLPLYVSVRSCYEKHGDSDHPLFEYLKSTYKHFPANITDMPQYLRTAGADWLLLLDGYNEAENIEKIQSDLCELAEDLTVVITTRDKAFVTGLDANTVLYIRLRPLEEAVVREYIAQHNSSPQLTAVLSDANMMVMLKNPMLLTMFCNSFDGENYHFQLDNQTLLTPGELIEQCVTAQLHRTGSAGIDAFFSTLCLFPMAIADIYYHNKLTNMVASRMDLTRSVTDVLTQVDIDGLEAFYLLEYADRWGLEVSGEDMEQLLAFLRERKPLDIRNELNSFEKIMSRVLQFFTVDSERSRIGGGLYRFDHQTSLNWYIAHGIYVMAELWPQRFSEIIKEITSGIDLLTENTDDYEEQSEFIFDLVRDTSDDESYRHFATKLFERHFAIRTYRLYEIATGCIELYDRANVSDGEYADEVSSFCYSLFSNIPGHLNADEEVARYGHKLETTVLQKAEKITDPEFKAITMAKINTIQGALRLAQRSLYARQHRQNMTEEDQQHLNELTRQAEQFQLQALKTREEVIASGSGKYTDEMRNRITHSYTSLGTIAYFLKDYDHSIEYHQKAYKARMDIMNDPAMPEDLRNDARIRLSINLNRINGSLLTRGNIDKDTLLEMFDREIILAHDNKIEREMLNQLSNFAREIDLIGNDADLKAGATAAYEAIDGAFTRMFGYQSDQLTALKARLDGERRQRINACLKRIDDFIDSAPFQSIIRIFNNGNELHDLKAINELADNWDYRRKLVGGGERQSITEEDEFVKPHREELISCFRQLGMLDEKEISFPAPDYVLPLGGYGMSNLRRCQLARKVSDLYPDKDIKVIALSSHRQIVQPKEFADITGFAPEAMTEYDEIDMAMRQSFQLKGIAAQNRYNERETREYWVLTEYKGENELRHCYNLSAPCLDPARSRANTIDTFSHLLKTFDVSAGSRIFLISTALYEPYQLYSLLPAAIEYGVQLEFIGCSYKEKDSEILATLCLQDLKSAVNAMHAFKQRY